MRTAACTRMLTAFVLCVVLCGTAGCVSADNGVANAPDYVAIVHDTYQTRDAFEQWYASARVIEMYFGENPCSMLGMGDVALREDSALLAFVRYCALLEQTQEVSFAQAVAVLDAFDVPGTQRNMEAAKCSL